jgi:hypothetical protein
MPDQTIRCPHCNHTIHLTEALTHQLTEHIQADFEKQRQEDQKKLEAEKQALLQQQKILQEKQKQQQDEVQSLLEAEKKKIWVIAQQKAKESQGKELKDLQSQLDENQKKLAEAEKQELELLKKTRELDERARRQELEMARKLNEEREKLVMDAKKQEAEEQGRKISEKDKQIDIMKKTIEDLRRQSEQGSMQIQGDAAEDSLKELLSTSFPLDIISDVPTGITGADLIQKVNARMGATAATILWESKNTKAFSEMWLGKLKRDQEAIKAELAILVTRELPKTITNFGTINGVWVTTTEFAIPLVTTLRLHLTEIEKIKRSLEGRDEKITLLYNYLTGAEFKNRIENIVLSFVEMRQDLDSEKNAFRRMWSKRQKQLERLMVSTSGMYGELQGIIGGALPIIPHLELEQPEVDVTVAITSNTNASLFDSEL